MTLGLKQRMKMRKCTKWYQKGRSSTLERERERGGDVKERKEKPFQLKIMTE